MTHSVIDWTVSLPRRTCCFIYSPARLSADLPLPAWWTYGKAAGLGHHGGRRLSGHCAHDSDRKVCVCLCMPACMHVCVITNLKDLMRRAKGQQQKEDSALAQWCPVSKSERGCQGLKPLFLYNEPPTHTTHTFHLAPFVLSTHFT